MQISYFFKNHAKLYNQFQYFKDSFSKEDEQKKKNTIKNIQTYEQKYF